jgi:hypothetical protein
MTPVKPRDIIRGMLIVDVVNETVLAVKETAQTDLGWRVSGTKFYGDGGTADATFSYYDNDGSIFWLNDTMRLV